MLHAYDKCGSLQIQIQSEHCPESQIIIQSEKDIQFPRFLQHNTLAIEDF